MGAWLRSWWQQIKKHRVAIGVVAIVLVVAIALIIVGYWFDWTGFNGYNKVTTTHIISGTNAGTVSRTEEYQPGKGLWDWLQLLGVLAIPVVVGFGAVWFTTRQGKVADAENTDNQRETALQAYIDKISELLLKEHLGELTENGKLKSEYDQVRKIARVRTITILFQLDARRIGYVFAFLREAGLMSTAPNDSIVSLSQADLSKVNFSQANLSQANLSKATLIEANFSGAFLHKANLSGAFLDEANLSGAFLSEANLSKATLGKADLSGADLSEANLSKANLFGADLSDADLSDADLSDALLSKANLSGTYLAGANLSGADLSEAKLSKADLSEANLSGADLLGTDLSKADLSEATLFGADLSSANLSGAHVTEEQLKKAKSLKGAPMPDGSIHP